MRKCEASAFVDFYFPQRAPFFPRLPRYYMLYFVHRLNTDMFLNMSIKLKAAISKLLACVIVAFFVGKITLNRLSLYNEHLKLNTKKLIDFGKFNQHFHSIYCSNIIYVGAADRNRTGTGITTRGILSPLRLPVPPPRQTKQHKSIFYF